MLNIVSAKEKPESDIFKMAGILEDEEYYDQSMVFTCKTKCEIEEHTRCNETISGFRMEHFSEMKINGRQVAVFSKEKGIHERIRILSSGNEAYLIYEVKGTGWNEDTKKYLLEETLQGI